ncbi:MAG: protein translocase subunit SecD [Candidatus Cloacimonetes bacterium]|nr:protein translocase subunit SecD [Candidatus Cloacimonadota bacterium]
MKNTKLRGLLILLVLVFTVWFVIPIFTDDFSLPPHKHLKLGLDLQGGSQIQLEVDFSELQLNEKDKDDAVRTAERIIRNRIDQFGVSEPSIQRVGQTNRIIVQLPGLKDPSRAKDLIGQQAMLEFKLLAPAEDVKATYASLDAYLKEHVEDYAFLKYLEDGEEGEEEVEDVFAEEEEDVEDDYVPYSDLFTTLTSGDGMNGYIEYKDLANLRKLLADEAFMAQVPAGFTLAIGKEDRSDPRAARPVYVLYEKTEISGKYLENAKVRIGQGMNPKTKGKPYISLKFNKRGAKRFATITGQNIKKRLAIVLDDIVYSAPTIQDKIPTGDASITGIPSLEEAQDLAIVLSAGNLPAPVNIIEERTVGPTLGKDSIKSGVLAAVIGMIMVVLFMLIYYGLSGLIADIALLVNIGFILATMTMLEGTLTMPGIAGMILTIGMAVDANVIIFERIRENLAQGKTIRTAVDGGFSRALITIVDANITTLITALVLYQFGTGPIKGFAVTLSIGIIGSMFASIVLAKAIFDGFITNVKRDKLSI